jgi:hypothetical protein
VSIRLVIGLVLLLANLIGNANQFVEVVKKDGRSGLKSADGEFIIPPVYDELGWSDGTTDIFGDLIGYKLDGGWGLVSIKNKVITPPTYYRMITWGSDYIKAAIKGKFSNHLFYGLIDQRGEVVLSCNYFDIESLNGRQFIVSHYRSGQIVKGLLDHKFELIVPVEYTSVEGISNTLIKCQLVTGKYQFYTVSGNSFIQEIDDYTFENELLNVYSKGRYGVLSGTDLKVIHPISYKSISDKNVPYPFPHWEIRSTELDSIADYDADSLLIKGDLFFSHINGNQEVMIDGKELFASQTVHIKHARDGFLIAENQVTHKWSLVTTAGAKIISNKDSISFDGSYFYAFDKSGWQIFNRFGRKLSPKKYEQVGSSILNYVPIQFNNYWGLMDFQGKMITSFKFDAINGGNENRIVVDYLGKVGVIDLFGNWVVKPSFEEIWIGEKFIGAKNGERWSILTLSGKKIREIEANDLVERDGWIAYQVEKHWGMLAADGDYLADPIYSSVKKVGEFLVGYEEPYASLYYLDGQQIASGNERIQAVLAECEHLYKIKKDDKIGYIDEQARLRIANRYDDGGLLAEDRIPISLLGRWGYIDTDEEIVIQPSYDSAGVFDNGVAIVKKGEKYGLVGKDGHEVLRCEYQSIDHTDGGGYILKLSSKEWGAADQYGKVTLTPNYLEIKESSNGLLLVNRSGSWGILNPEGYTLVPFEYEEILQKEDYFLLKRITQQVE